jgi:hypothetical protein
MKLMRRESLGYLLASAVAGLSGCATTRLDTHWSNGEITGAKLQGSGRRCSRRCNAAPALRRRDFPPAGRAIHRGGAGLRRPAQSGHDGDGVAAFRRPRRRRCRGSFHGHHRAGADAEDDAAHLGLAVRRLVRVQLALHGTGSAKSRPLFRRHPPHGCVQRQRALDDPRAQ